MFGFMKCVVEAVAANGIQGLLEFVPGGPYVYKVGADAIKFYREKNARKRLEDEVKEMVEAKADVALAAAKQAVEEGAPQLSPREKELVLQFVSAMPEAARQSLKRKEDPTGTSLPLGFTIHEPEDVAKILPQFAPRFLPGDWVPNREDNWRLERRLGGGGFGQVWLARHAFNKKEKARAVKFCTDPKARRALATHEKQVVERVMNHVGDHPNIVPLLECHLSGETPWLMYEFVAGGTLTDVIRDWQTLAPAERLPRAISLLHTLAGAIGCGHAHAIIHRDLKPANVLMDLAGPRVTDYGIGGLAVAYLTAGQKAGTYTAAVERFPSLLRGSFSPFYSSPQQREGDAPDARDDVHALGVLAFQMLVGRVDVEVKGDWHDQLEADGVPMPLIRLIGRSTSDNTERRPKDAREWEAVLDELIPIAEIEEDVPPASRPKPVSIPPTPTPLPLPKVKERVAGEVVGFPLIRGRKMAFCWIPPGTAQLGSPLAEQKAVAERLGNRADWLGAESEAVRGSYTTKGFWLAKYPVTQAEWFWLTIGSPSYFRAGGRFGGDGEGAAEVKGLNTARFPVEKVSWDMICGTGGFLEKLNAIGGTKKVFGKAGKFALPHENMWEYACRGGLGNDRPFYFGKELNGTQANIDGHNPFGTTTKGRYLTRPTVVGEYASKYPHPWGLCDMHGNVWEWCENFYDQTNDRVVRGGSWTDGAYESRAAFRHYYAPDGVNFSIGFRLCLRLDF